MVGAVRFLSFLSAGRLGCAAADAHQVQPVVGGGHLLRHRTGPDRTDLILQLRVGAVRKTHNTVYHPSCTVRMGADDDPSAPLDARLRVKGVKGVEGLRVADGSVMPDLVTVNPCITTMTIGEKCADLIKADY